MRFEVPQFIDIENKIFGPLTWKQFLYMGGGIGVTVVLFLSLPLFLAILFAIPIMLLASALSFYTVNGRPFVLFLEAMFNYLSQTKLYLWRQKKENVYIKKKADQPHPATNELTNILRETPAPRSDVASLSRRLELEAIQKEVK